MIGKWRYMVMVRNKMFVIGMYDINFNQSLLNQLFQLANKLLVLIALDKRTSTAVSYNTMTNWPIWNYPRNGYIDSVKTKWSFW